MADDREEAEAEGWEVPFRNTAIAGILVPLVLFAVVMVAGWAYDSWIRPKTSAPITAFPAPGIEAAMHDGVAQPDRPEPPELTDTDQLKAKQEIAKEGLDGWEVAR